MVYGDIWGWLAPFTAPFVWAFLATAEAGFFVREAVVRLVVRLTGADATEAGILAVLYAR